MQFLSLPCWHQQRASSVSNRIHYFNNPYIISPCNSNRFYIINILYIILCISDILLYLIIDYFPAAATRKQRQRWLWWLLHPVGKPGRMVMVMMRDGDGDAGWWSSWIVIVWWWWFFISEAFCLQTPTMVIWMSSSDVFLSSEHKRFCHLLCGNVL